MKITLPKYFKSKNKPYYLIYDINQSQILQQEYFHHYYAFLSLDGHDLTQHIYDAHDILSALINTSLPHFLFTRAQAEYCIRCFGQITGTNTLKLIPIASFKRSLISNKSYVIFNYDNNIINHTGLYTCLLESKHHPLHFKTISREDVIYNYDTYSGKQLKLLEHLLSSAKLNYIVVDYTAFRTAYQND